MAASHLFYQVVLTEGEHSIEGLAGDTYHVPP